MGKWQESVEPYRQYDDGIQAQPGEEGFTKEAANEFYGHSDYNYTGPSDPVVIDEETE